MPPNALLMSDIKIETGEDEVVYNDDGTISYIDDFKMKNEE